jgi:hypothetical protein
MVVFTNVLIFTNSHLAPFFVYVFCMTRRNDSDYLCKQSDQLELLMGTTSNFVAATNNVLYFNASIAELNPICHLLALLGARHILHISRIRVNYMEFQLKLLN